VSFDLILIALAITLEPIPLTGFILLLSSERGTRKGLGFLLGWLVTLVALVVVTLVFTGGKPPQPQTAPSTGILAAKILIGVLLLAFAWHYRRRPAKPPTTPNWMKRIDTMGFWSAVVLAFLLQPWALIAAGAATITAANVSNAATFVDAAVFCILATSSYFAMESYALLRPESARQRLDGLRQWLDNHRSEVIWILSFVVGLWLIGKSAYALAT
jgi:phage shock protein PspC (stress-responsive transcriptional regulator)